MPRFFRYLPTGREISLCPLLSLFLSLSLLGNQRSIRTRKRNARQRSKKKKEDMRNDVQPFFRTLCALWTGRSMSLSWRFFFPCRGPPCITHTHTHIQKQIWSAFSYACHPRVARTALKSDRTAVGFKLHGPYWKENKNKISRFVQWAYQNHKLSKAFIGPYIFSLIFF